VSSIYNYDGEAVAPPLVGGGYLATLRFILLTLAVTLIFYYAHAEEFTKWWCVWGVTMYSITICHSTRMPG